MKENERKLKFLAVKLRALESELSVSREIVQNVAKEVDKMFMEKYFPEIPQEPEQPEENTEITSQEEQKQGGSNSQCPPSEPNVDPNAPDMDSANKNIDPDVKKLFKKISSQIHPDKLSGLADGFEKTKKSELYHKAREAYENNDLLLLADVALELDLDVPELSDEKLRQTERKIIAIKRELAHIESTLVWQWFFTNDGKQKKAILEKLFEAMYERQRQNSRA
jgi:hypothetical protein